MGIEAELVIEDTSNRLRRYLLSMAGRNAVALKLASVLEEEAEQGNGGDSDVEGDDAREHNGAMNDFFLDRDINSSIEEKMQSWMETKIVVSFPMRMLLRPL